MWTIFKVFIEFVTILLLFYVLVLWLRGMWNLSSPTRDQTCIPCIGRRSVHHWTTREVPVTWFWKRGSGKNDGVLLPWLGYKRLWLPSCSSSLAPLLTHSDESQLPGCALSFGEAHVVQNRARSPVNRRWGIEAPSPTTHEELNPAHSHKWAWKQTPSQWNLEMTAAPADTLTEPGEGPWDNRPS